MNKKEIKSIMSLISERQEIAYKRLKGNLEYQEICDIQEKNLKEIEKLYSEHFTKEEHTAIRHYYEGETEKNSIETKEIYIQGLKDCFKLVAFLGLLSD